MVNKAFLENIKAGDVVVRALTGGGFTTYSLLEIEHVDETGIFVEGADGDYEVDSVYRFSKHTGKSANDFIPGFYSTLMRPATEADKKAEIEGEDITL